MSIIIENITKIYGEQKALDSVSFEVKKGEILGFLGPNGAGKSTLMKIVTCFIKPTEGTVKVNGIDVLQNPLEVKKILGYLPEHNPLYFEMYVKEYLHFIAGIHKLKNKKQRVSEVIEMVGLGLEEKKRIGTLSKGYKQRVGLAQALIHDPQVLILDEPTSGLDPNQLADIREVIKTIGREKTVMFSTHIMQEVEAICDRVVIINRGKLLANESSTEILNNQGTEQIVIVEFDQEINKNILRKISGVKKIESMGTNTWKLSSNTDKDLRKDISKFASENDLLVLTMQKETRKLEDIFKTLTIE